MVCVVYPLPEVVVSGSILVWGFFEVWDISTYVILYFLEKTYICTKNPIIFHIYVKYKDGRWFHIIFLLHLWMNNMVIQSFSLVASSFVLWICIVLDFCVLAFSVVTLFKFSCPLILSLSMKWHILSDILRKWNIFINSFKFPRRMFTNLPKLSNFQCLLF